MLVDHNGLFICVDPIVDSGYLGFFHDVTIQKNSWVEANWTELFANTDDYSDFFLGGHFLYLYGSCLLVCSTLFFNLKNRGRWLGQGHTSLEKYIMRGFSKVEMRCMDLPLVWQKTSNRMHVGY